MANQLGKRSRMYLDDLDVYLRSFEMEMGIESVTTDASKYGDDWEIAEVVQGKGRITINSYLDDVYSQGDPLAAVNNNLELLLWKMLVDQADVDAPIIKETPAVLTFIPFDAPAVESDGVLFMQGFGQFAIQPVAKGLVVARSQIVGAGPLNRGKILAIGNISVDSGSPHIGAAVNFDAPNNFVRASMHCFTFTGGVAPVITVFLESDALDTFGSPITRLTFPTFSTMVGQYAEVALTDTDVEYRVQITSDNPASVTLGIIVVGHTE